MEGWRSGTEQQFRLVLLEMMIVRDWMELEL